MIGGKYRYFKISVSAAIADTEPTVLRLRRAGKVPPKAIIEPLTINYLREIAALHEEVLVDPLFIAPRLTACGGDLALCTETSVQIHLDSRLIGFCTFLKARHEDAAFLFSIVVRRGWRAGWATPMLKLGAFHGLKEHGVDTIAFSAADWAPDTIRHAHRAGAVECVEDWPWTGTL